MSILADHIALRDRVPRILFGATEGFQGLLNEGGREALKEDCGWIWQLGRETPVFS